MSTIKNGDYVFLIYDKRRKWLRKVEQDKQFHSDRGFLDYNDIIGNKFGYTALLKPHSHKVAILPANPGDIIFHMKRESQIIYPEDIGLIVGHSQIHSGSKILEAGTGSGTVTAIMGLFVQPAGKVFSFDIRENAMDQARKNIAQIGAHNTCQVNFGNICEDSFDFTQNDLDFVLLDLAQTWNAVPNAAKYLKEAGCICCFSPTMEQVRKNIKKLVEYGFVNIHNYEQLTRTFQVKPNATRPHGRMVGHTGYMTFAHKTIKPSTSFYQDYYSPEIIGNLAIYGAIFADARVLIISKNNSLTEIFSHFLGSNNNLRNFVIDDEFNESNVSQILSSMDDNEGYSSIIVDNINLPRSLPINNSDDLDSDEFIEISSEQLQFDRIAKKLMPGGTFCLISTGIDNFKPYVEIMNNTAYYNVFTYEIIKRELVLEGIGGIHSTNIPNSPAYLTFGRKIVDDIIIEEKPLKEEYIEPILDVGLDIQDNLPKREDKIDYANLKDDY